MMLTLIRHSSKKAATAVQSRRNLSSSSPPIVEIREYVLKSQWASDYIGLAANTAPVRKSLLPMRLFCVPETGGQLNVATHFYFYEGGIEQRDETRNKALQNDDWKTFLSNSKPYILTQQTNLYAEAPLVYKHNLCGMRTEMSANQDPNAIYEIRKYRMQLGYDTVPKYLQYLEEGLPSKLAATGNDPSSQLCTVLYTEVGKLITYLTLT